MLEKVLVFDKARHTQAKNLKDHSKCSWTVYSLHKPQLSRLGYQDNSNENLPFIFTNVAGLEC